MFECRTTADSWLYGLWRLYSSRRPEGHRRGVLQLQPCPPPYPAHTPPPLTHAGSPRLRWRLPRRRAAERRQSDGRSTVAAGGGRRRVGGGRVAADGRHGGRRAAGGSTAEWRRRQQIEPRTFPVDPLSTNIAVAAPYPPTTPASLTPTLAYACLRAPTTRPRTPTLAYARTHTPTHARTRQRQDAHAHTWSRGRHTQQQRQLRLGGAATPDRRRA